MARKIKGYGWIPDLPDQRDHMFAVPPEVQRVLPPKADLRAGCPPVYNQGNLGSCTANAIAGALEFDQMKEGQPSQYVPSRLFIYYNERSMEGTVSEDSGAAIRDGVKSVTQLGDCPEDEWPYDISKFAQKPTDKCYQDAAQHKAISYLRVTRDLNQMKGCMADGYPFLFGFSVCESFEGQQVAQSGHASLPGPNERLVGGHAVLAVGYEDANNWFIVRNSWGDQWGMAGYFTLPYPYLTQRSLSSDFWTIRFVA